MESDLHVDYDVDAVFELYNWFASTVNSFQAELPSTYQESQLFGAETETSQFLSSLTIQIAVCLSHC